MSRELCKRLNPEIHEPHCRFLSIVKKRNELIKKIGLFSYDDSENIKLCNCEAVEVDSYVP